MNQPILASLCALVLTVLSLAPPASITVATDPPKAAERPPQTPVLAKNTVRRTDVAYGEDDKQCLDVYAPTGARKAPIVVFIHGGEWTRGDKSNVSYKPKLLNENGIVFISVNYRLTPPASHPAHVSDVASAIRWTREHAEEFGGDPKKIFLMGHSAGCHLATLVALDPRYLAKCRLRPADVRGVIAWSGGAYDLVEKVKAGGAYADYIRKTFGDAEESWRAASPVAHVKDVASGPAFLFVSIERGNASHQAAEHMGRLIRDAGGKADSRLIEGRDHFNANHLLGAPDDRTGKLLLEFIRETTR
jgi:acetyl esterase/lipase